PPRQRRHQQPHRRPVAPAPGHRVRQRAGHRHRRQAHHLPRDGRGHRRHRRPAARRPAPRGAAVPHPVAAPAGRRGVGGGRRARPPPRRALRRRGRRRAGDDRRRPLARRAARARPPLPAGRGPLRRALRDGDDARRRPVPPHPGPAPQPRRHRGGRRRGRRAGRARARLVGRGAGGPGRRLPRVVRARAARARPAPARRPGRGLTGARLRAAGRGPARPARIGTMSAPHDLPPVGPAAPTPPIALAGGAAAATPRLAAERVEVDDRLLARLRDACAEVTAESAELAEASRDWWPLAMSWATEGQVAGLAAAVARPTDAEQVAAVLALCHEARVPVTAAGGRSGVCGASVPLHGGVVLDLTGLAGVVDVDETSLVLDVRPGTFGDVLEHELRDRHGATLGHWPQSVSLSTVGGWLACRSAGQLSGRYGKIEDMVLGLDVALADGRRITTGGWPRAAVGPDLTQLFVGSEGTLGVVTGARLRLHPAPVAEQRGAWLLPTFEAGLEAMRRTV